MDRGGGRAPEQREAVGIGAEGGRRDWGGGRSPGVTTWSSRACRAARSGGRGSPRAARRAVGDSAASTSFLVRRVPDTLVLRHGPAWEAEAELRTLSVLGGSQGRRRREEDATVLGIEEEGEVRVRFKKEKSGVPEDATDLGGATAELEFWSITLG